MLAMLLVVFLSGSVSAQIWSDGWLNEDEGGWGVNIIHQYNVMFVCMYVYGSDGTPRWYSASLFEGALNSDGFHTYTGDLYYTTGPWFGGAWGTVDYQDVGTMTFSPVSAFEAELSYSINGVTVSKDIARYTFRYIPLSGTYQGVGIVTSNTCSFGSSFGTYDSISLVITKNDPEITIVFEDSEGEVTREGGVIQFGGIIMALTLDWVGGTYLQRTDFVPAEAGFTATSTIYGPSDCKVVYSIAAVKVPLMVTLPPWIVKPYIPIEIPLPFTLPFPWERIPLFP